MNQHEKIREYMKAHGSISPMEAFATLHITKLATRISEMIRQGEAITKDPVVEKKPTGEVIHYMRYRMVQGNERVV